VKHKIKFSDYQKQVI